MGSFLVTVFNDLPNTEPSFISEVVDRPTQAEAKRFGLLLAHKQFGGTYSGLVTAEPLLLKKQAKTQEA